MRMKNYSDDDGFDVNRQWPTQRFLGRGNRDSKVSTKQAVYKEYKPQKDDIGRVLNREVTKSPTYLYLW